MKKVMWVIAALVMAFLVGMYQGNKAAVGAWLYDTAAELESSLYGLRKETVVIGDMGLSLYRSAQTDKPAIVMLHGFSANKILWLRFARHFTNDYYVIIPDLAGHGESPFDPEWDYSAPAQAKRMQALLAELNIERAHFIGNSMGGLISANVALQAPDKVLSLTLMDSAGVHSPQSSDMNRMLEMGDNPFLITTREEFDQFYAMTMAQPPYLPDMVLEAVSEQYIARFDELEKIFNDFYRQTIKRDLPRISVPTLLLWGDQDRLLDVSAVEVFQQGLPHAQVHIFQGVGHMPMLEVPSEAAKVYKAFLTR